MLTKSSWIHAYVRSLLKALRRISFTFSSPILVQIDLNVIIFSESGRVNTAATQLGSRYWRCLAHLAMQPISMYTHTPHVTMVGQYLLTCHHSKDMPNDRSNKQDCYLKGLVHRKRSFGRIEIHNSLLVISWRQRFNASWRTVGDANILLYIKVIVNYCQHLNTDVDNSITAIIYRIAGYALPSWIYCRDDIETVFSCFLHCSLIVNG